MKNLNREENLDANEISLLKERYLNTPNDNNIESDDESSNQSDDESDNESDDSRDAESVFSSISALDRRLDRIQFTPIEDSDSHLSLTTFNSIATRNSKRWQQKIVFRLKEAIAETYLRLDSSEATHSKVFDLIRTYSQENDFPNIETYRNFRFSMYMNIMNDARSGLDKAIVFRKWKNICKFDMKPCEKHFLRSSFQY